MSEKLTVKEKVGYGLGDTASNIVFQVIVNFMVIFYTDVFGIGAAAVGTLMLVVRVFDMFTDPMMGGIADRTETRWGKYRPYLILTAIPYGILAVVAFSTPDLDEGGKLIYAYVTYALLMTAYTAVNIPYSALGGVITADPKERAEVQAYRFALAMVGGFIVSSSLLWMVSNFGSSLSKYELDKPGSQVVENYSIIESGKDRVIEFLFTRENEELKSINGQASHVSQPNVIDTSSIDTKKNAITLYGKAQVTGPDNELFKFIDRRSNDAIFEEQIGSIKVWENGRGHNIGIDLSGKNPTLNIINDSGSFNLNQPNELTFSFSETVEDFDQSDITVANGSINSLTQINDKTWTASITPDADVNINDNNQADDVLVVSVADNSYADEEGFKGTGNKLVIDLTGKSPSLIISIAKQFEQKGVVSFDFSEPVTRFDEEDINVKNAAISNFKKVSDSQWQAELTANDKVNTVSISVGDNSYTAIDGYWVYTLDTVNEVNGYRYAMAVLALIACFAFILCFLTTKERVPPTETKNEGSLFDSFLDIWRDVGKLLTTNSQWAVMAAIAVFLLILVIMRGGVTLYYTQYYLTCEMPDMNIALPFWASMQEFCVPSTLGTTFLTLGFVAAALGAVTTIFLTKKVCKVSIFNFAAMMIVITSAALYFVPKDQVFLSLIVFMFTQYFQIMLVSNMFAMVADTVDYGELQTGKRVTAMTFSAHLFALKMGIAIGGAMVGWLLAGFEYAAPIDGIDQVQSEKSLLGILLMFSIFPAIFAFIVFLLGKLYKLDDATLRDIHDQLDKRHTAN